MEINYIKVDSYPSSEKIYVAGKQHDLQVGMRKINLTPCVRYDESGNRIETPNSPVVVYDTSGPYTDPNAKIDIYKGLPRTRTAWINQRADVKELPEITSSY